MQNEVIEKKVANFLIAKEAGVATNSSNWVGGTATLTPASLVVAPNGVNALLGGGSAARDIPLSSVVQIDHESSFGMDTLSVRTADAVYKIRCYGAKEFKAKMDVALRGCRGESGPTATPVLEATDDTPPQMAATPISAPEPKPVSTLIPCRACNHSMAISAKSCPQCGGENNYIHPKIADFKAKQFPSVPEFEFEATGVSVTGAMDSKRSHYKGLAFGLIVLTFLVSIFIPFLFWVLFVPALAFLAFAVFAGREADKADAFKVDFSSGRPVWHSTNDTLWAPVKAHFLS